MIFDVLSGHENHVISSDFSKYKNNDFSYSFVNCGWKSSQFVLSGQIRASFWDGKIRSGSGQIDSNPVPIRLRP